VLQKAFLRQAERCSGETQGDRVGSNYLKNPWEEINLNLMASTFIPVTNFELIVGFVDRRGPAKMFVNTDDISHFYEICHSPLKVKIVLRSSPATEIVAEGTAAVTFLKMMGGRK